MKQFFRTALHFILLSSLYSLPCANLVSADELRTRAAVLTKQFCVSCHGNDGAEAHINLEKLGAEPDFATQFRNWEKVVALLQDRRMPPADAEQPTDAQRKEFIEIINSQLGAYIQRHVGDPGRVVMRRLTSAEYRYAVEDLTGLKLNLELVDDAVGGEGFTNVGDVQFIQDATMERYLDAACLVASHAVIGSGPLDFYTDPGRTGRELSAIHRIQQVYRQFGFRTSAGEGGIPFGLHQYPDAFYAAWLFRYRQATGNSNTTLSDIAKDLRLMPPFVVHIASVLNQKESSFPTSEIVALWNDLPPADGTPQRNAAVRLACQQIYARLYSLQNLLASAISDEEEAAVLTAGKVNLTSTHSFEAVLVWPDDAKSATLELSVLTATQTTAQPLVVWRNPRIRFRQNQMWAEDVPLRKQLTSAALLPFGKHPRGAKIDPNDFALGETKQIVLDFPVLSGATSAKFLVDVELDLKYGDECVARCSISDGVKPGETASATGTYAALLADPQGTTYLRWKPGVEEFARLLPEVSHREPAPSDRDPLPEPFDNTYNTPERNHFHARLKYHRDDDFFVRFLLNDAERQRLEQAWSIYSPLLNITNCSIAWWLASMAYHLTLAFLKSKQTG